MAKKFWNYSLLIFFMSLLSQPFVFSQTLPKEITEFMDAVKNKDDIQTRATTSVLLKNPAALKILEEEHPSYYSIFRLQRMKLKLDKNANADLSGAADTGRSSFSSGTLISDEDESSSNTTFQGPGDAFQDNREKVLSYPNQNRPANFVTAETANKVRVPNGQRVLNSPNQNRRSNQEILNSRLGK
ncbi:MAG: hypothetical protein KC713_04425 [Candidatus Omnitrophica bacterium]|nr:hypothetical protein [Candidatus Omnitrophota bacterium]